MSKFDEAYLRMQQFGGAMISRLADYKKEIDDTRAGKIKIADNCPSRASAVHTFLLDRIKKDIDEVNAAYKECVEELWKECGNK